MIARESEVSRATGGTAPSAGTLGIEPRSTTDPASGLCRVLPHPAEGAAPPVAVYGLHARAFPPGVLTLGLLGDAQTRNAALVLDTVEALRFAGLAVPESAVARGLARVRWPGRFEVLRRSGRTLILDGAHNVAAIKRFCGTLHASPWHGRPKRFILGILQDKEYAQIARLLAPHLREVTVTRPRSPRALDPEILARELARWAPRARVSVITDPVQALEVWRRAGNPQTAVVLGSFYLVGLARRRFQS